MNNNLIHLQIQGKNKLVKEIEETKNIQYKTVDHYAIHRNEATNETEGEQEFITKHRKVIQGVKNTFNTHRMTMRNGSVISWTSRQEEISSDDDSNKSSSKQNLSGSKGKAQLSFKGLSVRSQISPRT